MVIPVAVASAVTVYVLAFSVLCMFTHTLQVDDLVFCDFCTEIGIANIREYEQEHLKQQQETDSKR